MFKLLAYLKPYWPWAAAAPALMMAEVALDLSQPRFVQRIIDHGIASSNLSLVVHTGLLMAGVSLVAMACGIACGFFAVRAAYGMGGDLRTAVFRRVQTLSFGNLDQVETGALITRLTSDVNQVQEMAMMMLRGMVRMPLLLAGSLVMAVITSPKLGWIFVVVLPVLVAALVIIIRRTFPLYGLVQRQLDRVNTVLQENLAGVRVVKAFARGPHESARFARANRGLVETTTSAVRMSARTTPVMTLTLNLGIAASLWIGGRQVARGGMKIGEIVAFISYLMQAIMSLLMFSNLIVQLSRAQASARRVTELLGTRPEIKPPPRGFALARPEGAIAFENVSFSYAARGGAPVLKNVSFTAAPGETVALVGATGAGKSSLIQLIPRFYDAGAGRVTLDGADVRDIPERELRRHIGIALQDSILFSDTIRNNIAFGVPGAPLERIVEAATWAQADEFIRRLPEGYETVVGQRGVNLSGGQKQRLAIARALLLQPAVLILDDSTSAVDVRTEARIHAALGRNRRRQTRVVVAQRVSTVIGADKIIVLEDGAVVGEGTHPELLRTCAVYREIHQSQTENGVLTHGGE